MSRELWKPSPAAVAVRHPNGRVTLYQDTKELLALNVPPIMGPGQLEVTMSPKGALDLYQALLLLIDSDSELRAAAGREDPEALLWAQTNGLEKA